MPQPANGTIITGDVTMVEVSDWDSQSLTGGTGTYEITNLYSVDYSDAKTEFTMHAGHKVVTKTIRTYTLKWLPGEDPADHGNLFARANLMGARTRLLVYFDADAGTSGTEYLGYLRDAYTEDGKADGTPHLVALVVDVPLHVQDFNQAGTGASADDSQGGMALTQI